ncbi:lytic murein transglycosylase [Gymnodinialimonas sp. 2305UL16-5]|uniref:lytic murein transglycosylase n=1 Tax=Gymnodinialimonas mytili TaxID=3126503 RepID=UPI0030A8F202
MVGLTRILFSAFAIVALPALASPPDISPLPTVRPSPAADAGTVETIATRSPRAPSALAVVTSIRPQMRADVPPSFAARAAELRARAEEATRTRDPEFRAWIEDFKTRALAMGIRERTLTRAFEGVQLNTRVLERDANQAEFSRALWEYLDSAVSATRVRNGRTQFEEYRDTLARIEQQYEVEAEVVVAIWGLESAYGASRGSTDIIEAMASLAYDGRRQDFFEEQLIAALRILDAGDTNPRNMTGSWAGAMGHTQFMPTSYLQYAQDFNGDGRRNIWSGDPTDALASTAHYLAEHGWTYGQPWGMEVELPNGFDFALAGEQERRPVRFWNDQGVRLAEGGDIPDHGQASILLPAGAQGVALVIFDNFRVIERYNPADAYVIAVGHLGDRIGGGPAFEADWPRQDRALTFAEREELQRRLQTAGHYDERIDGIIGPNTIAAVRRFQAAIGVTPDGYASPSILERLRRG